ncbi:hypothetical protein ACVINW_006680 [Bradyrhizobium sp. USDA 4461]
MGASALGASATAGLAASGFGSLAFDSSALAAALAASFAETSDFAVSVLPVVSPTVLSSAATELVSAGLSAAVSGFVGWDGSAAIFSAMASRAEEASDIVAEALAAGIAPLASAVWVLSRSEAVWPTLLRRSSPDCLSAPLSLFTPSGASIFRMSSATGCCGATLCVTSSGCEKFSGEIVPGVTNTRAPIRVQLYILTANDIGMRMQPWEAG